MTQKEPRPDAAHLEQDALEQMMATNSPAGLGCPDCGGSLWHVNSGGIKRYQCHVGHAFLPESLIKSQGEEVERQLWTALRLLREQAVVAHWLAAEARSQKRPAQEIEQIVAQAEQALHQAETLHQMLLSSSVSPVLETRSESPISDLPMNQ